ncbi:MAG: hypothetical protein PHU85_12395 [Phycisphaerae bacterium]|nr:hypothetical protein [Phycisphaerae bacterium]
MTIRCLCPNCGSPATVTGPSAVGWVSCNKCGHVYRIHDAMEPRRKSSQPANSPHLGVRP